MNRNPQKILWIAVSTNQQVFWYSVFEKKSRNSRKGEQVQEPTLQLFEIVEAKKFLSVLFFALIIQAN